MLDLPPTPSLPPSPLFLTAEQTKRRHIITNLVLRFTFIILIINILIKIIFNVVEKVGALEDYILMAQIILRFSIILIILIKKAHVDHQLEIALMRTFLTCVQHFSENNYVSSLQRLVT